MNASCIMHLLSDKSIFIFFFYVTKDENNWDLQGAQESQKGGKENQIFKEKIPYKTFFEQTEEMKPKKNYLNLLYINMLYMV